MRAQWQLAVAFPQKAGLDGDEARPAIQRAPDTASLVRPAYRAARTERRLPQRGERSQGQKTTEAMNSFGRQRMPADGRRACPCRRLSRFRNPETSNPPQYCVASICQTA